MKLRLVKLKISLLGVIVMMSNEAKRMTESYLSEIARLNAVVHNVKKQLETLDATIRLLPGGSGSSSGRVQTSRQGSAAYEKAVERKVDLEAHLGGLIESCMTTTTEIINQINALPKLEFIKILYYQYVSGKDLTELSYELGYSYDHTRKLRTAAIESFWKTYHDQITAYAIAA